MKAMRPLHLELNPRRERILRAVVEKHISTAMPVSSETIVKEYKLGISPATVRIELAVLESMGLVKQPHTSAGRVPSDKGYRFYVDRFLSPKPLKPDEAAMVRSTFQVKYCAIEELLRASLGLLASLTGYAALASFTLSGDEPLSEIHITAPTPKKLLVMVTLSGGKVFHRLFCSAIPIDAGSLKYVLSLLRASLCGLKLSQVLHMRPSSFIQRFKNAFISSYNAVSKLLRMSFEMIQETLRANCMLVFVSNFTQLLSQPEFKDVDRARSLVELLSDPLRWFFFEPYCIACEPSPWTAIGMELLGGIAQSPEPPKDVLAECSLVGASYFIGDMHGGNIAVLGPKRMRYDRALSAVNEVAKWLSISLTSFMS